MISLLYYIYDLITKTIQLVLHLTWLPFGTIIAILKYIFNTIFIFQIAMSGACEGIFGPEFGCYILNPSYVFTSILFDTIKISILIYLLAHGYDLWINRK